MVSEPTSSVCFAYVNEHYPTYGLPKGSEHSSRFRTLDIEHPTCKKGAKSSIKGEHEGKRDANPTM